jgi:anti-sigma regulatory factor (Ser/Thr protein kinase)
VADDGRGFDAVVPGPDDVPDGDAEDGRGLYLVRTLVDRCTIFTNDGGTVVRCRAAVRAR